MPDPTRDESDAAERERRDQDRRAGDRRRPDRRAPAPLWRRPWAYALYGVLGAFVIVILTGVLGGDEPEVGPADLTTVSVGPEVDSTAAPAAAAPPRTAMGAGEYERLVAQGEAAVGQRVVTQLYCGSVSSIGLQSGIAVSPSIASVSDAGGRVPGAECTWGEGTGAPELLLLVPADLAPAFAAAPEVEQSFVRRRSVRAEIEWIGRSEALALRTVGLLRGIR